jgi:hypothetical protein
MVIADIVRRHYPARRLVFIGHSQGSLAVGLARPAWHNGGVRYSGSNQYARRPKSPVLLAGRAEAAKHYREHIVDLGPELAGRAAALPARRGRRAVPAVFGGVGLGVSRVMWRCWGAGAMGVWVGLGLPCGRWMFASMSRSRWGSVRTLAAEHPRCPARVLDRLSRDDDHVVVLRTAGNPSTPAGTLRRLVGRDQDVDMLVGSNVSCPPEVLVGLSRAEPWRVRCCVAANRGLPLPLFAEMVRDRDMRVRTAAVGNPGCPRYLRAFAGLVRTQEGV